MTRERNSHIFEREAHDHYAEPEWCSDRLFDVEHFDGPITDPCCGFGHIVQSAKAHRHEIDPRDVVDRGYPSTRVDNFLANVTPVRTIVFNSPYGILKKDEVQAFLAATPLADVVADGLKGAKEIDQLEIFTTHAVRLADKVAQFAPVARLNAAHWLQKLPLARIWLLTPRPSVPPGSYLQEGHKAQGGRVDFCWLIFERGFEAQPTLSWLHRNPPVRRAKAMADVNDTLKAAERTAARLLCQYPDINLADKQAVVDRCLGFKVDLRRGSSLGYAYENVKEAATFQRHCASIAAKSSWTLEELYRDASKLYDPNKGAEEQPDKFYQAQAQYRLVKDIRNGHQSQSQNAVA
jgi:hypothetical protein